jgi:hypothetical protein
MSDMVLGIELQVVNKAENGSVLLELEFYIYGKKK